VDDRIAAGTLAARAVSAAVQASARANGRSRQAADRFRRISFVIDNFSALEGLGKFPRALGEGLGRASPRGSESRLAGRLVETETPEGAAISLLLSI